MNNQTKENLLSLGLKGVIKAYDEQQNASQYLSMSFDERFAILIDYERTFRENQRASRLLKLAKLKFSSACIEDIDLTHNRNLDRILINELQSCDWIKKGYNLLLTGPAGCGKTWISCALGNQACRNSLSVSFHRVSILLEDLAIAHASGSFHKKLLQLSKVDLLILDDFGSSTITPQGRSDLLEIIESRNGGRSTIITSQLPTNTWHEYISLGNKTVGDGFIDRVIHTPLKIELNGESMRKSKAK